MRSSRVYSGRSKQNLLQYQIYDELVSRRKGSEDLQNVLKQVQGKLLSTPSIKIRANGSTIPSDVTLFVGQILNTQNGHGKIISFDIEKKKVKIQTAAGMDDLTFFNAATCKVISPQNGVSKIMEYWDCKLKDAINMSYDEALRINDILLNQMDDSDGTDNDISSETSSYEDDNDGEGDSSDEQNSLTEHENNETTEGNNNIRDRGQAKSEPESTNDFFPLVVNKPSAISRNSVREELFHCKDQTLNLDHLQAALVPTG